MYREVSTMVGDYRGSRRAVIFVYLMVPFPIPNVAQDAVCGGGSRPLW
jgi:hypothetical protein